MSIEAMATVTTVSATEEAVEGAVTAVAESTLQQQVSLLQQELSFLRQRLGELESAQPSGRKTPKSVDEEGEIVSSENENEKENDQEKEVEDAKSEAKAGDSESPADANPKPTIIPELKYVNWHDFKNIVESEPTHAIEVLEGPAEYYWQQQPSFETAKHEDDADAVPAKEAKANANAQKPRGHSSAPPKQERFGAEGDIPERIRINSNLLRSLITNVTDGFVQTAPCVFVRPYKLLVGYERELRTRFDMLNMKWGPYVLSEDREGNPNEPTTEESKPGAVASENEQDSVEALKLLGCLLQFIDRHLVPVMKMYRPGPDDPPTPNSISFAHLWYLFRPGDEVVCSWATIATTDTLGQSNCLPAIWRVLQLAEGRPRLQGKRRDVRRVNNLKFRCQRIGYDGFHFGVVWHTIEMPYFRGKKKISSLSAVPIRFVEDADAMRQRLLDQGKLFYTFTSPQHLVYSGPTLTHYPSGRRCDAVERAVYINGHIMVDFKAAYDDDTRWALDLKIPDRMEGAENEVNEDYPITYWATHEKKSRVRETQDNIYDDDDVDIRWIDEYISGDPLLSLLIDDPDDEELAQPQLRDEDLILLPDRASAFDLHRRQFALCDLKRMRPVRQDTGGWLDLKLAPGHQQMVQSQVTSHFNDKKARESGEEMSLDMDVLGGKGEGLIILLHGEPGTGKTSTAETVAAWLKKPLYPITCGDLGTAAKDVEKNLNRILGQAEAWDCVLLLDEADVFLSKRNRNELERNAIVSIFLRTLEYYKGLLFLTSNRVGGLDEAFISRIHLALYYPGLDHDQCMAIWRTNLGRTEKRKGPSLNVHHQEILRWATDHFAWCEQNGTKWNGRQIRNACQTAVALAEYEAAERKLPTVNLTVDHVHRVAEASWQFDEYIQEVIGGDLSHRARLEQLRADDFQGSGISPFRSQDPFFTPDHRWQRRKQTGHPDSMRRGFPAPSKEREPMGYPSPGPERERAGRNFWGSSSPRRSAGRPPPPSQYGEDDYNQPPQRGPPRRGYHTGGPKGGSPGDRMPDASEEYHDNQDY